MTQKLLRDVFYNEFSDILVEKIFSETENKFTFSLYDTSHSLFPMDDFKQYGANKFKQIAHYSFDIKEVDKFNEFLERLHHKHNISRGFFTDNANIFSLSETNLIDESKSIKNPYDYQFLKLHLSYSGTIAQKKMEEFINELKDGNFYKSNNKVYINNWVHIFLSIDKPYNLDGLKINEVEYDTSVFLNLNPSDKNVRNSWNAIKAGLVSVRH